MNPHLIEIIEVEKVNGAVERSDILKPCIDLAQSATGEVAFSDLRVFSASVSPAPRKRQSRTTSEQNLQRAVCQHLRQRGARGLVFWHTPNGGRRNRTEAAIFNGLGVRAGVADLVLLHDGRAFALELKAEAGRPTAAQMQFISEFRAAGGEGTIATGLNEALRTLEGWGLLQGRAA